MFTGSGAGALHDERYLKMSKKIRESVVPFAALLVLFLFLSWLIVSPLGRPLLWSVVLSYFAYPLYKNLHNNFFSGRLTNIAAGITTLAIVVFMAIPMLFFGLFLIKEFLRVYEAVMQSGVLSGSYTEILQKLHNVPLLGKLLYKLDFVSGFPVFESIIGSSVNWITGFVRILSREILGNAFKVFYLLAVVTVSSFFIVRDGHLILQYVKDIMPLTESERENIVDRSAKMLRAVVYGIVVTAAIQGSLGGLGWWFVGLGHPVLFGFFMFITGMIPFVGTPVIWVPGVLSLFINGDYTGGLILLGWGIGAVSMVDNFVRPVFISGESKIHMLVIFVGIFGGLFNWGFLGLFIGPLILSIGIFLLDLYRAIVSEKFKEN
ncbi:MAG: AI-2E family transporter [Synergistaceae bacterium]|jgi:predicted PurR-regulated permease PerM|nr:AI-2E family transporter [Synergistaceae bacterium]